MAFKKRKPTGKKSNPAMIFVILAVVSYVLGFPLPVTAFLAFVAYILFKAKKDGKSLNDLPIPPANNEQATAGQDNELSTDFGRQKDDRSPLEIFAQQKAEQLEQEPAPIVPEYQPREPPAQPKPAPTLETTAPKVTRTTTTRSRPSPYRIDDGQYSGRLVNQFRTTQGLRLAVAAMTVLGPPRSIHPYVSDPMLSTGIAPTKAKN